MCIVAIAHLHAARYPLIVAANRDERHARATRPAEWWNGPGSVLAGRDLLAGGSWLGVSGSGRFAAVTNIFEPDRQPAARSRGALVTGFLESTEPPAAWAAACASDGASYGPFNLVVRDGAELNFVSNRSPARELPAGLHVFSNNAPGIAWPKVERLAQALETAGERDDLPEFLIDFLSGPAARGPLEQAAEYPFIVGEHFGTRCTTIVTIDRHDRLRFVEQSFAADGSNAGRREFS